MFCLAAHWHLPCKFSTEIHTVGPVSGSQAVFLVFWRGSRAIRSLDGAAKALAPETLQSSDMSPSR